MQNVTAMLVLSRMEWKQWLITGILKFNQNRLGYLANITDYKGFSELMQKASDETYSDAGAYILARLHNNWQSMLFKEGKAKFLDIHVVEVFCPVSDIGTTLYKDDAKRLGWSLHTPLYQKLWQKWCEEQAKIRYEIRAKHLVKLLGFKRPRLNVPKKLLPFLKGESLPNDKVKNAIGQRIYPYAMALAIVDTLDRPEISVLYEKFAVRSYIKKQQTKPLDTFQDFFAEQEFRDFALEINKILLPLMNLSLECLILIFYYRELLSLGLKVEIEQLQNDLHEIAPSNSLLAARATYFIGLAMNDEQFALILRKFYANKEASLNNEEINSNKNKKRPKNTLALTTSRRQKKEDKNER